MDGPKEEALVGQVSPRESVDLFGNNRALELITGSQ